MMDNIFEINADVPEEEGGEDDVEDLDEETPDHEETANTELRSKTVST